MNQDPRFEAYREIARKRIADNGETATDQEVNVIATWLYANNIDIPSLEEWSGEAEVIDFETRQKVRKKPEPEMVEPDKFTILFGLDTESIEDPDNTVYLTFPGKYVHLDPDELIELINSGEVEREIEEDTPVPLNSLLSSMKLALAAEGVDESTIARVRDTVVNAISNNLF